MCGLNTSNTHEETAYNRIDKEIAQKNKIKKKKKVVVEPGSGRWSGGKTEEKNRDGLSRS